jgi:hypothetical protein
MSFPKQLKHRDVVNNSAAQSVHKKTKKSNSFSKRTGVPDQWYTA